MRKEEERVNEEGREKIGRVSEGAKWKAVKGEEQGRGRRREKGGGTRKNGKKSAI